jgi:hypothetical protein
MLFDNYFGDGMFPLFNDCRFFPERSGCIKNIGNWVGYDPVITWIVNILIGLAALGLIWVLVWYLFFYRRRPLCVDCKKGRGKVRTKFSYKGDSVCSYHWSKREMAAEPEYKCPKHGVPLMKECHDGMIIDCCPKGCVFLDDGELEQIQDIARSRGQSSGQATGTLIGMAIG